MDTRVNDTCVITAMCYPLPCRPFHAQMRVRWGRFCFPAGAMCVTHDLTGGASGSPRRDTGRNSAPVGKHTSPERERAGIHDCSASHRTPGNAADAICEAPARRQPAQVVPASRSAPGIELDPQRAGRATVGGAVGRSRPAIATGYQPGGTSGQTSTPSGKEGRMSLADCPFCAIVAGKAPATILRRWSDALAIVPLGPVTPGHVLIVPTVHVEDALTDPDVTAVTYRRAAEFAEPPCNLITNVGRVATQSVFHLHVHVIPRAHRDGLALPWHSGKHKDAA